CALVKNLLPTIRIHDAKKTYTNPKFHGRGSFLRAEFSQAAQQFPVTRQSQAVDSASLSAFSLFLAPPHPTRSHKFLQQRVNKIIVHRALPAQKTREFLERPAVLRSLHK